VDRLDADGTRVLGQESTNPPISSPLKNTLIMRATLHDDAPNTYYGQWPID
jgi:hypothetical protein